MATRCDVLLLLVAGGNGASVDFSVVSSAGRELFAVLFNGLRRSTYFKVVGNAVVVLVLGAPRVVTRFGAKFVAKLAGKLNLAVDAPGSNVEPLSISGGAFFLSREV